MKRLANITAFLKNAEAFVERLYFILDIIIVLPIFVN